MHQMVLQGDEAQVETRLGLFGDSANLEARKMHGFHTIGLEIVLDALD
jgi:hypothetical protein